VSLPDGVKTVADRLRAARLNPQEDKIRRRVLSILALGVTPTVSILAERCEIAPDHIREILGRLAAIDLLLVDATAEIVLAAYPFSAAPTPHRVRLIGREVFALCAVDALGIPAMLQEGACISSQCGHCGSPVQIQAQPEQLTRHLPSEIVVWFPISEGDCCPVAQSRCPNISFFCTSDHLETWWRGNGQPPGLVLSLLEAFEAGREIFGSLLAQPSTRYARRRSWRSR